MNKIHGITVIICTFNGMDKLLQPLYSIINQKTNINLELLIVDNASTDATVTFCTKILEQSTISWRIVDETTPGLNHARLRGLKEAIYDIILFCDDDNSLDTNYLENGFRIFENHPKVGAVGGCGSPSFKGVKPEWFDQYSYSFAVGPQANQDGILQENPAELYGAGTFFRKAPLLQLFNKNFKTIMTDRMGKTLVSGGDVEWCYLIQLLGYQLYYDHRLIFYHDMPASRMNWDYYLRLKAGIASGTGKMLPYICLFSKGKISNAAYIMEWFKKTIFSKIVYYRRLLINLISFRKLKEEEILACLILKSKSDSYFNNPISIYNHFKSLKKII